MYNNKQKVDNDLENGIADCADLAEDLFDLINNIFENKDNPEKINELKEEWEESS